MREFRISTALGVLTPCALALLTAAPLSAKTLVY